MTTTAVSAIEQYFDVLLDRSIQNPDGVWLEELPGLSGVTSVRYSSHEPFAGNVYFEGKPSEVRRELRKIKGIVKASPVQWF